jgi:hypothetical protein
LSDRWIVDTPAAFLEAAARLPRADAEPWGPPTARAALLVAPRGFRLAEESERDNFYMTHGAAVSEERALAEHARLARALQATLPVHAFDGNPATPDAVFPNNVFATVPGRAIVGRMRHGVRRREAERADLRAFLAAQGYELVDLSTRDDLVAELTGPLVVDRLRGIGFCGLTERCDRAGAAAMHDAFGLRLSYVFELAAGEYHTNVFMAVLAGRGVVLHAGSFAEAATAQAIASFYGERALALSDEEKHGFCGNAIALGRNQVWMSARAAAALGGDSRAALTRWGFELRSTPLEEIEKAGGSLRCCVAELY